MTFLQVVNIIRDTALAQPNVNTVVREFLDLNREDTKYSAVVIQDRDGLRDRIVEQDWNTYTFHLGYVDRLTFDESNRDDIFSTGINVINNIVASIRERWDLEVSVIDRFSTFNQRFTASCAGVYVVLAIQVPVSDCVDGEETDLYDKFEVKITENGDYHFVPDGRPVDEIDITVDVPAKFEYPFIDTITENGEYGFSPEPGSVFSEVNLNISVPTERKPEQFWTESYEISGTEQTFNFRPDDGYVFSGLDLTFEVPTRQLQTTISDNGTYHWEREYGGLFIDGYDITVAVPPQKSEESLVETISSNGNYSFSPTPGSVFSDASIAVDVHPTASLSKTYRANGTNTITGEFNGGTITINVHPSQRLVETITENGTTSFSGEWRNADITVAVPEQKPENTLVRNITNNDYYTFTPAPGTVYDRALIYVDVHPTETISETYTTNGTKTITGEYNGGTVVVDVHPSTSLTRKYTTNGLRSITGEWKNAELDIQVIDGSLKEPGSDEIYYTTYSGNQVTVDMTGFDVSLVSNTYQDGYGILKFSGPLTKVGDGAFAGVRTLRYMRLPSTVTTIGERSFMESGLVRLEMPDSVTDIMSNAFSGCYALVSPIYFSRGLVNMEDEAYANSTALQTITIRDTVTSLGSGCFYGCVNLADVIVQATVPPVLEYDQVAGDYLQFDNTYRVFRIRVPAGTLNAYQTAPGWSKWAANIIEIA